MVEIPRKLYRFFSVPMRDIGTLGEGAVYYSNPTQLNDPFDCQLSINSDLSDFSDKDQVGMVFYVMHRAMEATGTKLHFSTDEDYTFQRRFDYLLEDFLSCMFNYGIHSLSSQRDHPLMWSHYAAGFQGFALTYDTTKPCDLGVLRSTYGVTYQKEIPSFTLRDLFGTNERFAEIRQDLLTVKGPSWAYENEWRVIIWPGARKERIPYAISEVIFGHLLADDHREELRRLFGPEVQYTVAAPSELRFEVEFYDADSGRRRIEGIVRPHRKRHTYFYNPRYNKPN